MRTRWLAALALVAALGLVAPACGGDDSESSAVKSSDTRTEDPTGDSGSSGSSGDSGSDSGDAGTDTSMPDLSDLGELGDCMEIAGVYAGLALSALGSPEDAQQATDQAEELKAKLPADLHDDLDTVAEGFATVAKEGIFEGADALDTPEFNKANQNIEQYLNENCGG